ncbi:MAG: hypothetical protein ACREKK_00425 [Candidatus Methylomirabilales bacterium]
MPNKSGLLSREEWDTLFTRVEAEVKANPDHPLMVGKPEGNPVQIRAPWDPRAEEWVRGVQATGASRWEAGIQRPRANFKTAALANNDGWKAGVQAAVAGDKFARGMSAVNEDEAIQTALAVGGGGYASGAALRQGKFQSRVDAIKPRMAAVTEATRRMPARTLQERVARMVNQVQGAAAAGGGGTPTGR